MRGFLVAFVSHAAVSLWAQDSLSYQPRRLQAGFKDLAPVFFVVAAVDGLAREVQNGCTSQRMGRIYILFAGRKGIY